MIVKRMTICLITIMTLVLGGLFAFGDTELKAESIEKLPKQKINISKVYDFACPWCYVGKNVWTGP